MTSCQWHPEKEATAMLKAVGQELPVCEACYEAMGMTEDHLVSAIFTEVALPVSSSKVDSTPHPSTHGSQRDTRKASS